MNDKRLYPNTVIFKGTDDNDITYINERVLEQIRKRIKYETKVLDTTKGFAYCSGWMDAFNFALDIINEYTKGMDLGYNPYQE